MLDPAAFRAAAEKLPPEGCAMSREEMLTVAASLEAGHAAWRTLSNIGSIAGATLQRLGRRGT